MEELLKYQIKLKSMKTEKLLNELIEYHYWKDRVLLIKLEILSRTKSEDQDEKML